jgi:hypothetical protein
LHFQHTLHEKPLGKIENTITTVGKFTGNRLLILDILNILSVTGERLFGRYLPVIKEETIGAVTGSIGS